jgi:Tfp pilus assembly protein PilV
MQKNLTTDRGDSLLEVVISTVIMGIIGVLLISSIAVARPFADKMSMVGQTVQNLNTLAESINLQTFSPCSPATPQPYRFGNIPASSATPSTGFAITTAELPPAMVSTTGQQYNYSTQLSVAHAPGPVTWSVEPVLPVGLNLDSTTGVLSGSTNQALTSEYVFTATSGSDKATKNLILTSAVVVVLVNNGSTWVSCNSEPVAFISSASADGKTAKYSYVGKPVSKGDVITIWGSSNPAFNGNSLIVSNTTAGTFSTASSIIGTSNGGSANLSTIANVQQVIVSTVVSGSPLKKVITKAIQ